MYWIVSLQDARLISYYSSQGACTSRVTLKLILITYFQFKSYFKRYFGEFKRIAGRREPEISLATRIFSRTSYPKGLTKPFVKEVKN